MTQDGRWVRPTYLSLAAVAGLIVMMWGLITGALGGFHIYQPRYARVESDQGDVASAFNAVYSPLLQIGQTNGTAPPGANNTLAQAVANAQRDALDRAKDRGYNEAVKGALGFVIGGFVFLVGSSGAKRAGLRLGVPTESRGSTPNPIPASPMPRPAASQQPQAAPSSGRPVPVAQRPTVSSSPVGRLQEAPEQRRPARKAPPPPRPAPKRAPSPDPRVESPAPRPSAPPAPPAPPVEPPSAPPIRPAQPVAPPSPPSPATPMQPSQPPQPPFRPAAPPTLTPPPPPVAPPYNPPTPASDNEEDATE